MKINVVRLDELELERKAAHFAPYEALLAQGMARSSSQGEGIHVWVRGNAQGCAYVTRLTKDWRERVANAPLWGVHDKHIERVSALSTEGRTSVFCFERDGRYFVTTWVRMDGVEQAVTFTIEIQDGELARAYHGMPMEQAA
jgi:hypothetical protein